VALADLAERPARKTGGASFEFEREGRVVAIFDASGNASHWFLALDEWCAEVATDLAHDDWRLEGGPENWPRA
jgi:hypothetical protein